MYYDPSGYADTPSSPNSCDKSGVNPEQSTKENIQVDSELGKLYRQMCLEEAEATIREQKLQYAIKGTESTKWITESKKKAFKFKNRKNVDKKMIVIEFEVKKEYHTYLRQKAVFQGNSKNNPNNKFHYEGLPESEPYKNFGILKSNIEQFNDNVISAKIIDKEERKKYETI